MTRYLVPSRPSAAAGVPGTLVAANGALVDFGHNLNGFGTVISATNPLKPFIVNGAIAGNSAAEPITFDGSYIKGVGTLDHFVLTGGAVYSPGFSPATVHVGSGIYGADSRLIIELGGTIAGSEYDQVRHWGDAELAGALNVQFLDGFQPDYGQVFDVMTFAGTRSGKFDFAGLQFTTVTTNDTVLIPDYQSGQLRLVTTGPGDANLDGTVNFLDFLSLQNAYRTSGGWTDGDFDFSGTVDFLDFLILQNHYHNVYFTSNTAMAGGLVAAEAAGLDADQREVLSVNWRNNERELQPVQDSSARLGWLLEGLVLPHHEEEDVVTRLVPARVRNEWMETSVDKLFASEKGWW